MMSFLISLLAAFGTGTVLTRWVGLRTNIIARINLAAVAWGIWEGIGRWLMEETPAQWTAMGGGLALGMVLAFGFAWWQKKNWGFQGSNFELEFAARLSLRSQRSISTLVVRLGVISIMLGVAVMDVTISLVFGFQGAIHEKVIGFGSHIRVGNLLEELESQVTPLPRYADFMAEVATLPEVRSVSPYVMKPAMLKSKSPQEGVVMKGLDSLYEWSFFEEALQSGRLPDLTKGKRYSQDLLISRKIADILDVELDEKVVAYFFEEEVRVRTFKVCGIYNTDLGEFDQQYVMCDLRALQGIWGWETDQVAGFEVKLNETKDLANLDEMAMQVQDLLPYQYEATPIHREYPELFEWVELQHQNVWFILGLMVIIAVINMISVLLILILERTRTIGLLKSLGMSNLRVWNLFVANGFVLVLIGLVLGNALGLGLLASQEWLGWLQVDQENYFVQEVPVEWVWQWFLAVNLGVLVVCTVFMYIPALLVLRINPVRALRFD